MLFSSITFLYLFLPVVLALYYLAPRGAKNYVLLAASLLFYFFGEPVYTSLLIFSSLSDYFHSIYIERRRGTRAAKVALTSSIVINLGLLGFFKYTDFFVGIINGMFGAHLPLPGIALPIGISFFTFQTMSYTIDVYRGRVKAEKNLATLATFVCLFPQLIAGPIVRYSDISAELHDRQIRVGDVSDGARRFVCGLAKKVLIANAMGELCAMFRDSGDQSVLYYWIYAVAFTLQIYFDFSGYSDMAIGLGKMLGFTFPENFDYPYLSRSITEFWRRWHMTLGGWFRDYVYIPLGGNRVSKVKWIRNIAVVWLLTGLWHGASWNFVAWGAIFGLLLAIEKLWLKERIERAGKILPHIYVLFFVIISFVVFNAQGLSGAARDIGGMFGFLGAPLASGKALFALRDYGALMVISIFGATPLIKRFSERLCRRLPGLCTALQPVVCLALLAAATAYLVDGSFNPFLYFRF